MSSSKIDDVAVPMTIPFKGALNQHVDERCPTPLGAHPNVSGRMICLPLVGLVTIDLLMGSIGTVETEHFCCIFLYTGPSFLILRPVAGLTKGFVFHFAHKSDAFGLKPRDSNEATFGETLGVNNFLTYTFLPS
ncbi:hypothetical protein AR158_C799L [Paramecium bursaria Chlorella virus AR158]|uniref:hypothetical protein n=1 Tax=Paramecium bursaria Chlorella virus AR158 TaxID=380598 RepID=UPI00015AA90A|nr:hypothetical protein AR158_C799L [Paramecium bursaria Chlorella virus AR158]ABU44344.1 hypothetical protein AR158_C799L [Paramecium bursaria Chlorella virus AR158]